MQMQTARARAPRGLLRRPPFWLVLVLVVGIFTALTGAAIGGLAWWENYRTSRALLETVMAQTTRLATDQIEEFLRSAESAVRLGPQLVASGQLDPDDERQLERFTLATLRAFPGITCGPSPDGAKTCRVNSSVPKRLATLTVACPSAQTT